MTVFAPKDGTAPAADRPASQSIDGGPLRGLKVVDLTTGYEGFTGQTMGDLGATVVKVEPPSGDFLASADKSFLVTGLPAVPDGLKDKIAAKKVVWGVDYDPEDVPAGIARADAAKKALGSASVLIAYLKSIEKSNDLAAKRALYFGLIKLGWKPEDIAAFAGNSLRALNPMAMGRAMMMR